MVLLFFASAEKTSKQYIEYDPYLCFHRNTFLFPGFLFWACCRSYFSTWSLFALLIPFCFSPIAPFNRFFSEPPQKRVFRPVCSLSARPLLPSINPTVSRFTQRVITLYIWWLGFSSDVRFTALSITPCTATTTEFYAEHSSWRHAMPEKFRINFTMR